mmetsp:Transcript_6311/g.11283  ORF Transcript_6311/g.11283 Transcript_6311/m.11283 type:complete len:205 (-) Transcript_6311:2275-2889(-)
MRIKPDFSSFIDQTLTSTNSPVLSLRGSSSFLLASFASCESRSKWSVMIVSLTTLKTLPPSMRKTEPAVPFTVTNPVRSSFRALHFTRVTLPSTVGKPWTSTTSPAASFLLEPSVMLSDSVMVVSFTTFIKWRMKTSMRSLLTLPSSSIDLNSRERSSDAGATAPSSFSQSAKKAVNESSAMVSPPPPDRASQTSSGDISFFFW